MNIARVAAACILALSLFTPVYADDAEIVADVRCVLIGMQMIGLPDVAQHSNGMMTVMYYLGKLDRANPKLDIEGLIVHEAAKMTIAESQSEARRCGNALIEKGKLLRRIGSAPSLSTPK
jgi:hypothetical protein